MIQVNFELPNDAQMLIILGWLNDPVLMKYSEQRFKKHSINSQHKYYRQMEDDGHLTGIILNNSSIIGTVAVTMDEKNGIANAGILIGSPHTGKGYGHLAWGVLCEELSGDMGDIRKIEAGCRAQNKAMIRIFEKNGMRLEGTRKYHFWTEGGEYDHMVLYGMLT